MAARGSTAKSKLSPYELAKANGTLARRGRPRSPGMTDEERAERKRTQALFGSLARGRAMAVLAAEHEERYAELLDAEKAWLRDNDERFEDL